MKLAIYGYGNLGKGVEKAALLNKDTELAYIFTNRPGDVKPVSGAKVIAADKVAEYAGDVDVLVICAGSKTTLPTLTPALATRFNVVDSFDTHAKIPEHFANTDASASASGHTALISAGWDPGMFSINRVYGSAILPEGKDYTFWGPGVSQGHSEAVRGIKGVKDARQYTLPVEETLKEVRNGSDRDYTIREKHTRLCYVVAEDGADRESIEKEIKEMPNYFADYDTTVVFVTEEELKKNHSGLPHGGFVIRSGNTGGNRHIIEYSLKLDSNPEFTGSALVAFARAVFRMHARGMNGCYTPLDVSPADLNILGRTELIKKML